MIIFKSNPMNLIKATQLGNQAAKKYALSMIKNDISGHLKSSLVFAWLGA